MILSVKFLSIVFKDFILKNLIILNFFIQKINFSMLPILLSRRYNNSIENSKDNINKPLAINMDNNKCQCDLLNENLRFKIDNYKPKQGIDCPCCQCKVNMGLIDLKQYENLCSILISRRVPQARKTVKLNNFYKSQDSISETKSVQDDESNNILSGNCIIT